MGYNQKKFIVYFFFFFPTSHVFIYFLFLAQDTRSDSNDINIVWLTGNLGKSERIRQKGKHEKYPVSQKLCLLLLDQKYWWNRQNLG